MPKFPSLVRFMDPSRIHLDRSRLDRGPKRSARDGVERVRRLAHDVRGDNDPAVENDSDAIRERHHLSNLSGKTILRRPARTFHGKSDGGGRE